MTPQQIHLVQDLLVEAKGLKREEREPFLKSACAEDSELLAEVRSLLEADNTDAGASLLDMPAMGEEFSLKCLLGSDQTISSGSHIGRYQVLELLGEGGMGAVYMAEQHHPIRRVVAIKLIKAGVDTKEVISRFESERRTLAQMEHPNIARVIDAGTTSMGRPYFVMEYVPGVPITRFCDSNRLTIQQRLLLFIQACEAISHAHIKATIHRDLKPSNVLAFMLDGKPTVKVIDFGIAKALTSDRISDHTQFTLHGQVLGSFESMSPEQADGSPDIDARTDVYSLGSLLYELLTGCTPLDVRPSSGTSRPDDIHHRIRDEEPLSPSARLATLPTESLAHFAQSCRAEPWRLIRAIRGDLDWIVMRCLEKDANRRYRSASDLAADITRYINSEAVLARPPSRKYRLHKLLRRYRLEFAAAAVVLASVCLGAATSVWQAVRATRAEVRAIADRDSAEQARLQAESHGEHLRRNLYVSEMNEAGEAARLPGGVGRVMELLERWEHGKPDLRNWEWFFLRGMSQTARLTLRGHMGNVSPVAWSPDGSRLLSCGGDGFLRIWDKTNGEELLAIDGQQGPLSSAVWSADGTRLAASRRDGGVRVWDARTGMMLLAIDEPAGRMTIMVAWSPDGLRLAWNRGMAVIISDASSGEHLHTLEGHQTPVTAVAWSHDGTRLASTAEPGQGQTATIKIWDAGDGSEIRTLPRGANSIAWSPDDTLLATGGNDRVVNVYRVSDGARIFHQSHDSMVLSVGWNTDGSLLASAGRSDWAIKVWNVREQRVMSVLEGHQGQVGSVVWSPDGTLLASCSTDGTVKIWDAPSAASIRTPSLVLRGPTTRPSDATSPIAVVAWRPDGVVLASGGHDGSIKVWDAETGRHLVSIAAHRNWVTSLNWSPDGKRLASSSRDRTVRMWDMTNQTLIRSIPEIPDQVNCVAWSPDGTQIASHEGPRVKVWDAETGNELFFIRSAHTGRGVSYVAWSPDGKRIASAGGDHLVKVWDATSRKQLALLRGHVGWVNSVRWNPQGTRLASSGVDRTVRIWDVATAQSVFVLRGHTDEVFEVDWSSDGQRLVSASWDGTARVWDTSLGRIAMTIHGAPSVAAAAADNYAVAWNPDGFRLAVGGRNGSLVIYNSQPGHELVRSPKMLPYLDRAIRTDRANLESLRAKAETFARMAKWQEAAEAIQSYLSQDQATQWFVAGCWLAGPYPAHSDQEDSNAGIKADQPALPPPMMDNPFLRQLQWQPQEIDVNGYLDIPEPFERFQNLSLYARLRVFASKRVNVEIIASPQDSSQLWLNGSLITQDPQIDLSESGRANLATLEPGWNTVQARFQYQRGPAGPRLPRLFIQPKSSSTLPTP